MFPTNKKCECCKFFSLAISLILGIITVSEFINISSHKKDITKEICNITNVEYPIIGETENFISCKCGKRCHSDSMFCNKLFMKDIILENSYNTLEKSQICSFYGNTDCNININEIIILLTQNEKYVKSYVNNSIECYKKKDIYFLNDSSKLREKNAIMLAIFSFLFLLISILGFRIDNF